MINIMLKVLTSNLIVLALKLISGFVFPNLMSTQSYADYQTFCLYLSYIPILHLGFPTGMFVNYGGQPFDQIDKGRYKSEVNILVGILCFFTVLFGVAWLFIRSRMLLYITLCILPYCVVSSYQSLYQAWGEFGKFTRTNVVTMAVPLLGSTLLFFVFHNLEAEYYIFLFLAIYVFYTVVILFNAGKATRGIARAPYFDQKNWQTLAVGFSICIGNYVNVLFHSVDKQFVKLIFDTTSFAVYSFGLSLQSILMVFVTSIAQPMYNFLASGQMEEKRYNLFMRLLLMLGACSGVAYHACSIVVAWLVPKYTASMEVTAIYFMAFPALAVINCMYINLYKLTRQAKQYIRTLVKVLLMSVVLNAAFVFCRRQVSSITLATVAVYYLWLFMDARRFKALKFGVREIVFLACFFAAYLISMRIANPYLAAIVYILLLAAVCGAVYRDTVRLLLTTAARKIGIRNRA